MSIYNMKIQLEEELLYTGLYNMVCRKGKDSQVMVLLDY